MADIKTGLFREFTKDPKKIKWQKIEAILEHISEDFLVGFIGYRGHFLTFEYQRTHFKAAVGALDKKKTYFICKERL